MKLEQFDFDLPQELIAQIPAPVRSESRLLKLDPKATEITHHHFYELPYFLHKNDCLIFNNSKVIPARLYGKKKTGGKVEVLLERIMLNDCALVMLGANKPVKLSQQILLDDRSLLEVIDIKPPFFVVKYHGEGSILKLFEQLGQMPLPPYIKRLPDKTDEHRYQTIYAKHDGAVAAPTAGLHFDDKIFHELANKNIVCDEVTLHVGSGTFKPVRVENIEDHEMHHEWIQVPQSVCDVINQTKERGGRVIAVGTTTVRSLETAAAKGQIQPFEGETNLFIYPGYKFKCVDAMITNFHLPKSSLLMMISAFAGIDPIFTAYREAIAERYRFFSYGDAMFIINRNNESHEI